MTNQHRTRFRDDFSETTKRTLAQRAGMRCSNPGCRQLTAGPQEDEDGSVNIGVAAHISAASVGGPRYDGEMEPEQRKAAENGIWLCQNCAKLVDNDQTRYPVSKLKKWKVGAEEDARSEIEKTVRPLANHDISIEILHTEDSIESDRHDYTLLVSVTNEGSEILDRYFAEINFPARVLENKDDLEFYVADRSTADVALFRIPMELTPQLYPGDSMEVYRMKYYVDKTVFYDHEKVFDQLVSATVTLQGGIRHNCELVFSELQDF